MKEGKEEERGRRREGGRGRECVLPGVGSSSLLWAFLITSITSLWGHGKIM